MPSAKEDRKDTFTPIYALWSIPVFVAIWWRWVLPDWDWNLIALVGLSLLCLACLAVLAVNLFSRRWKRVLSLLLAPIVVVLPFRALADLGVTPDSVRFALTKQTYLDIIESENRQAAGPRLRLFAWDDSFVDKAYWTLVYDESDEIAWPAGTQSYPWQQRLWRSCAEKKFCLNLASRGGADHIRVERLDGHFYLLAEGFPNAVP